MPQVCLQYVIVVLPDHIHLLFMQFIKNSIHIGCIFGTILVSKTPWTISIVFSDVNVLL